MLLCELHSQLCLESHRKIRCKFFIHGHCPFRSECIYLHELPARRLRRRRRHRPRMPAVSGVPHPGAGLGTWGLWLILPPLLQVSIPSSSESSEEDEELHTLEWARTLAMLEEEFPCPRSSGREILQMLLFDFIDSD